MTVCSLLADLLSFQHINYFTGEWYRLLLMISAM